MTGSLPISPTSPNTCGLLSVIEAGNLYSNSTTAAAGNLLNQISILSSSLSQIDSSIISATSLDVASLTDSLQELSSGSVTNFYNHLTTQIADLTTNISIVSSALSVHLGLINAGCGLPTFANSGATATNPTPAMQIFFGSITGNGASLITSMEDSVSNGTQLAQSFGNAQNTWQTIANQLIVNVQTVISIGDNMQTITTNETNALVSVNTDMSNYANVMSVLNLYNTNPCAALVINAIGSANLLALLKS